MGDVDILGSYFHRPILLSSEIVDRKLTMQIEKPLFIPLRTEWFRKFEDGTKTIEYRAYGPRWNERTCKRGRPVTLSHGYNGARLSRYVHSFMKLPRHLAPVAAREIFPSAEYIAAIKLRVNA